MQKKEKKKKKKRKIFDGTVSFAVFSISDDKKGGKSK